MTRTTPPAALVAATLLVASTVALAAPLRAGPGAEPGSPSGPATESGAEPGTGSGRVHPAPLWRHAATPEWVDPVAPFTTPGGVDGRNPDGVEWRLLERQFDGREPGKGVSWHAREYAFLTRRGVAERSRLEIAFDPAYQRLALHEVSIRRGARTIDKRPTLRADLLHRERQLDRQIHDGERTLNLLLDDVRVGDVVRLAYSLEGENPILAGHRELMVPTERHRSALGRQRTRLLAPGDRPFHVRRRGRVVEVSHTLRAGVHEHLVDLVDPPLADEEENVPPGARDGGLLVFGDLPDWASVVAWARPLYRLDPVAPAGIVALAARIRTAHPDDEGGRIGAALRWVQEEIRYFGIELGTSSHRPASPTETLARRYGDCKGKSLLLIALLDALGVAAEPALVDTYGEIDGDAFPWRLHAFDHVLVHVAGENRSHWLDPTLGHQRGSLGELHEPDHGRALVLASGEVAPRDMATPASARRVAIDKHLVIPLERTSAATLDVETRYHGRLAASLRADIDRDGLDALGRGYVDYYDRTFDGIGQRAMPEAVEAGGGTLRVTERYRVPAPWHEGDEGRERWLFADEIDARLGAVPEVDGRRLPFALAHPVDIVERWHVTVPEPRSSGVDDVTLDTPWFTLTRTHELDADGTALSVTWRYRSRADRIEVADAARYAAAFTEARRMNGFRLMDRVPGLPWLQALPAAPGTGASGTGASGRGEDEAGGSGLDRLATKATLGATGGALGLAGVVAVRRRREHRAVRIERNSTSPRTTADPDR